MGTSSLPDRLSTLVQLRDRTDVTIGPRWIVLAITSYLLWIVFAIFASNGFTLPSLSVPETLGIFGTLAFSTSTGTSFLVYGLLNRQNKHAEREQEFAWEMMNRIQSRTDPSRVNILLPLSSAQQDFSKLLERSCEHSAILWSLLVLIPYAGWIFLIVALYLLTQASNLHERMERSLFEDLDLTLAAEGSHRVVLDGGIPRSRNSVAYAIASVLTVGIVALSWLYIMVIGEEAHFRYHSSLEPILLGAFLDLGK